MKEDALQTAAIRFIRGELEKHRKALLITDQPVGQQDLYRLGFCGEGPNTFCVAIFKEVVFYP